MIFRNLVLPTVILASYFLCSCSSAKSIHKRLTEEPVSMQYLVESTPSLRKNEKSIYLETDTAFVPYMRPGQVETERWFLLPLIFYWQFKIEQEYTLGRKAISESPYEFLETGFLREAKRNCVYNFTPHEDSADYTLVLRLDSLGGNSQIHGKQSTVCVPIGPYIVYVSTSQRNLLAAESFSSITYDLYNRDNRRIKTGKFQSIQPIPDYPEMGFEVPWAFHLPTANAALVEGVSHGFRDNFQSIIDELNQFHTDNQNQKDDELHQFIEGPTD